jgi:hypothetical protein
MLTASPEGPQPRIAVQTDAGSPVVDVRRHHQLALLKRGASECAAFALSPSSAMLGTCSRVCGHRRRETRTRTASTPSAAVRAPHNNMGTIVTDRSGHAIGRRTHTNRHVP